MEEKYDIFISYRRKEGNGQSNVDKARSIYYELRARGYSVFFDFEECTDGYFSNKILPAIRTCNYFLLVLTKDALLRCSSKGDWVRREIEEAIRCGRKIIPVSPDGVFAGWPEDLPESLLPLAGEDGGLQVTTIHTDSSFKSDIGLLIDLRMGGGIVRTSHGPAERLSRTCDEGMPGCSGCTSHPRTWALGDACHAHERVFRNA